MKSSIYYVVRNNYYISKRLSNRTNFVFFSAFEINLFCTETTFKRKQILFNQELVNTANRKDFHLKAIQLNDLIVHAHAAIGCDELIVHVKFLNKFFQVNKYLFDQVMFDLRLQKRRKKEIFQFLSQIELFIYFYHVE